MQTKIIIMTALFFLSGMGVDNRTSTNITGTTVRIQLGILEDGRPTALWMEAIKDRNSEKDISNIASKRRPFTDPEKEWIELLSTQIPRWAGTINRLVIPFGNLRAPQTVTILIGNQGGDDGFTFGTRIICLDLSAWTNAYGPASDSSNIARAHRILSHEFTHLMSKAHARSHPPDRSSPLCRALYTMYYEGLGNFHSLSDRWYEPATGLKEQSRQVLEELGPIFVDRLLKLADALPEQEAYLRDGLSEGPFRKKWGALPVALWLKMEAGNDPMKLCRWVDAGPCGVLDLAKKHLPAHLLKRIRGLECHCAGHAVNDGDDAGGEGRDR